MKLAIAMMVHDDHVYLPEALASFRSAGTPFVFVSRVPWHEDAGDWERSASITVGAGAEIILGEWGSELAHRRAVRATLQERGFTHALIPDGDEFIEPALLESLMKVAEKLHAALHLLFEREIRTSDRRAAGVPNAS